MLVSQEKTEVNFIGHGKVQTLVHKLYQTLHNKSELCTFVKPVSYKFLIVFATKLLFVFFSFEMNSVFWI